MAILHLTWLTIKIVMSRNRLQNKRLNSFVTYTLLDKFKAPLLKYMLYNINFV